MRIGYKAIRVLITYPRSDNLSVYEPELPIWKPLQNLRGPTTMPVGGKLSLTGLRDDTPNHIGHHGATGVEGAGGTGSPAAVPVGGKLSLTGLRDDTPNHIGHHGAAGAEGAGGNGSPAAVPVGGGRARAGLERTRRAEGSRVAISRAARPSRRPEHPWGHSNRRRTNAPRHTKTDIRIGCRPAVELGGFEPPTFSLRTRRATNCAIAPRTQVV